MNVSRRTAPSRWQCSSTLGIAWKKARWAGVTTGPVRASGTLPGFIRARCCCSLISCPTMKTIAIVMGVSGSGKTTVAVLLAGALGVAFLEDEERNPAYRRGSLAVAARHRRADRSMARRGQGRCRHLLGLEARLSRHPG